MREKITSRYDKCLGAELFKAVLISGVVLYLASIFLIKKPICSPPEGVLISPEAAELSRKNQSPTNISHLLFGLIGSEKAWHHRKAYIESWWRPGVTRGFLYLDVPPTEPLLPWSQSSPPYRVSDDINQMIHETKHVAPISARIVHGIMEVFRERHEGVRWVVMGDEDSVFFVENMVDVLAQYDHTKYHYLGGQSEFVMSHYWFSFNQGFGGAGFILSYPLAEALSNDMDSCLRRYAHIRSSSDHITMLCIADLGVNFSPLKGIHQIDLRGDLSGFLSSHPKFPLLSLHHLDTVEPIFPAMDRYQSAKHLVRLADYDQTRMLQQTICYHRQSNWSVSVSWGYSIQIYEKIHPRSYLQMPIETFQPWIWNQPHPLYMFNTRLPSKDPCEAPHVFFLITANRTEEDGVVMTYLRSSGRGSRVCLSSGNHSAAYVSKIEVYSPSTKRPKMDKCECCDIIHSDGEESLKVKYRKCLLREVIA
ncbi:PREDICTED: uncharacterized protein LOC109154330 isoform X3 [Ipomoea nil]|uniref:uncharacterized protein LOC109154330 isoform X3 n=1 Tax=Ipomoea nil TaxID=35883 RepID=UPI0009016D66|nr:PREDICTED: uncharacterized protein LOC109154330 isoform X3 [Ipomoea nil]